MDEISSNSRQRRERRLIPLTIFGKLQVFRQNLRKILQVLSRLLNRRSILVLIYVYKQMSWK